LIHNEVFHYDNHEWIAKASVLSFEEQPIKYMQTVRHYLLYIFIDDFNFCLQGLFEIPMDNMIKDQLSLFQWVAAVDHSLRFRSLMRLNIMPQFIMT
jgi:hypothetical protein